MSDLPTSEHIPSTISREHYPPKKVLILFLNPRHSQWRVYDKDMSERQMLKKMLHSSMAQGAKHPSVLRLLARSSSASVPADQIVPTVHQSFYLDFSRSIDVKLQAAVFKMQTRSRYNLVYFIFKDATYIHIYNKISNEEMRKMHIRIMGFILRTGISARSSHAHQEVGRKT